MSKTGVKIPKGIGFSMPPLRADHPIFKGGFAIGVVRSTPSSKNNEATTSPSSSATPAPSSTNPPQPATAYREFRTD